MLYQVTPYAVESEAPRSSGSMRPGSVAGQEPP